MAGELSRAAQARADKEAAALKAAELKAKETAEAEAAEKKRLEAEAAAAAEPEPEPEDDKEKDKKKTKGKKAEGDCPDDEKDKEKMAAQARADVPAIIELCVDAGVPKLAAALTKEGLTLEQARERIDAAGEIRQMVGLARKINPAIDTKEADNLIAAGASKAHAKTMLFDKLVSMQSTDIAGRHSAGAAAGSGNGLVPTGNHGWDNVIEKVASAFKPPQAPKH